MGNLGSFPTANLPLGYPGLPAHTTLTNPNLNFQQPHYQTMAYSPKIPPTGTCVPHGPILNIYFPRTPTYVTPNPRVEGEVNDGVRDQIARTLEFSFTPKGRARSYQKPYPEYFDTIPYPRGFQVPDLAKITGDDTTTTYEHIAQFLAQVNDVGIIDVHKIRMLPLSLAVAAFNWFTSFPPNSIDSWVGLEQKFHDYFYNGEVELKLSNLTSLRQKYTKTISDYLRQFREVRNRCYNLTIAEKDLADLPFVVLTPYLKDKLYGQEFSDTNQLLQRVLPYENRAKSSRFWDNTNKDKEKHQVHFLEEEADDEEGNEICVAEWVEKPRDKPISCSFLKPNGGRRDELRYTFGVMKCDRLFDLLLQGGVIRLTEGHIIPNADILAKKTYCKWQDSYTHTTNKCIYFQ
jgi:hypothetical protein